MPENIAERFTRDTKDHQMQLDDGRDPLTQPFLSDNDVTLDQCYSLAEQLALGARIVARAIESPRSPQGRGLMMTLAEAL